MTKSELSKLKKESPTLQQIDKMEETIALKLNHDGRWHVLPQIEGLMRMGNLTRAESNYLGAKMGWDEPYHRGVDWDAVPTTFLAICLELPEKRIVNTLSYSYPSPDRKPVFEAVGAVDPDAISDFLLGDISFDELREYAG